MEGGAITTVAPSTTATALTSIATGLAPAQHGIVGYRMLVDDDVLNVLRWTVAEPRPRARSVRRAAPRAVPRSGGAGRHARRVPRHRIHAGAPARRTRFAGWHTVAGLDRAVRARGRRPASGSCTRTTRASTRSRTSSACTTACSRASSAFVDRFVGELIDALPATRGAARHLGSRAGAPRGGVVDRDPGARRADARRWRATAASATSTRRPSARKELLGRARELCSDRAWVWSRAEVLEMGMFGDGRDRHGARAHRQRRARGARAGRVRRSRAAATSARCDRATAASRPTRCTCRCSPRAAEAGDPPRHSSRSTSISSVTPTGYACQRVGVSSIRHTSAVWPRNGDWIRATSNSRSAVAHVIAGLQLGDGDLAATLGHVVILSRPRVALAVHPQRPQHERDLERQPAVRRGRSSAGRGASRRPSGCWPGTRRRTGRRGRARRRGGSTAGRRRPRTPARRRRSRRSRPGAVRAARGGRSRRRTRGSRSARRRRSRAGPRARARRVGRSRRLAIAGSPARAGRHRSPPVVAA